MKCRIRVTSPNRRFTELSISISSRRLFFNSAIPLFGYEQAHVIGPTSPPLSNHTIGSLLDSVCKNNGHLPAVISSHQDRTLSYNELNEQSTRLALNLQRLANVKKGVRVAVCCGNRYEYPVIQMGLGRLGAILVPLNTAFTDNQFQSALSKSECKILITQTQLSRGNTKSPVDFSRLIELAKNKEDIPSIERIFLIYDEHDPRTASPKIQSFRTLLDSTPDSTPAGQLETCSSEEVINMQFTSGTTSSPKISCLTHRNIVNNGLFIGDRMNLSAYNSKHPASGQDHLCIPVPMFHCFGLVLANLAAFCHGVAVVYPSEAFDAKMALQVVRKYNCTGLYGVPTMFSAELELRNEIDKGGFEYLSKGIAAGSPVPIEIMKELIKTMNLNELTICYGMTETSPVSFMTSPNDALDKRTQTVGKIMPHTEAKIIKPPSRDNVLSGDLLRPLAVGTKGEIAVSGYLVQTKYYEDPDNSASAMIKDNEGKVWMLTGDEGFIDRDGYLTITGRIKDLIIRGGENIHPLEIENVLFTHKLVSQASVVGIFDGKYGESIVAYVITHSYTSLSSHDRDELVVELKKLVTDRLGKFFTPENIIFLDRFPKTASGKIRKVELREMAEDLIKQ